LNPRLAEIEPSLIRAINSRKQPGDIDLGLGEPTLLPDPRSFEAAMEWTRRYGSPYSPNAGFPELREAIAGYLGAAGNAADVGKGGAGWAGGTLDAGNVCVTIGSEEALYLALKTVVDPARHEVLIVEPCYLAYAKLCALEGIRHRLLPLDADNGFRPSAAAVLDSLAPDTRVVVINSPCNPTGRVWAARELETLARGLAVRGGEEVFVLSDEVYRELYYGLEPPASPARFHPQTLVAGSLSKSNALTGLRLGWLAGPAPVIAEAIKVHQLVNTAASTFAQRVALSLLSAGAGLESADEEPVSRFPALAAHRSAYVAAREQLVNVAAAAGLEIIPPEGAFYGFLRLPPGIGDSVSLAVRLLDETRVVTVPGRAFGNSGEGWLRLSFTGSVDTIEDGLHRIARWLASVRG
jgi:aminotransferase